MRDRDIDAFLDAAGWSGAASAPMAGDASDRRYRRLTHPETGEPAVLMDAGAAGGATAATEAFRRIARHLAAQDLSAPRILAAAPGAGLMLLEDLGDGVLARIADATPAQAPLLYAAAIDLLAEMQRCPPPPDLARQTPAYLARQIAPVAECYIAASRPAPDPAADRAALARLQAALRPALAAHADADRPVLVHRDFHAENLIWLPERQGAARIGILDFQDALAGHPAYDLVSLLEDARRDIPEALRAELIARYQTATGHDSLALAASCAVLGAQRNLRILGVFARLARLCGKPSYARLMPRVWRHLQGDLQHPALGRLREAVTDLIPPPEPELAARLSLPCPTAPTP